MRGWRFLEELRTDVRYGLRWLTRSPGFAAAAILSLGLGIGANTAVFSLLDAVLLKSLPVSHPDSLVVMSYVTGHPADGGEPIYRFTYRMFEALRRPGGSLDGAAASAPFAVNVDLAGTMQAALAVAARWRWRRGDAERAGTDGLRQLLHAARRARGRGTPDRAG